MYKDIVKDYDYKVSIASASITATTTGSEIDLQGAIDVKVLIPVGIVTTADATHYFTFTVTQCATSGGSFTAAATTQYHVADSWDRVINATTEGSALYAFQFKPTKRYMKVVATETSTGQAIFGAYVEFTKRHEPGS